MALPGSPTIARLDEHNIELSCAAVSTQRYMEFKPAHINPRDL
jgi:hypothetical protein